MSSSPTFDEIELWSRESADAEWTRRGLDRGQSVELSVQARAFELFADRGLHQGPDEQPSGCSRNGQCVPPKRAQVTADMRRAVLRYSVCAVAKRLSGDSDNVGTGGLAQLTRRLACGLSRSAMPFETPAAMFERLLEADELSQ